MKTHGVGSEDTLLPFRLVFWIDSDILCGFPDHVGSAAALDAAMI
jgi:hypothetical protein